MAGIAVGGLIGAGTRFAISHYNQLSTPVGVTYNLIDMAVSAIAFKILENDPCMALVTSRVIAVVVAVLATTFLCGPIDLPLAIALNLSSCAVSVIMGMAFGDRRDGLMPV